MKTSRIPGTEISRFSLEIVLFSALFAGAALLNSNWLYNALLDSNCYLGLYYDFPRSLNWLPDWQYQRDRLAFILPYALAYSLLSPHAANLMMDYAAFMLATLFFCLTLRLVTSWRTSLFASVLFALHPQLLAALGADYFTGKSILFAIVAQYALLRGRWLLAGVLLGLLVHSNVFAVVMALPGALVLRGKIRAWALVAAGAIFLTVALIAASAAFTSEWYFFRRSLLFLGGDIVWGVNPYNPSGFRWLLVNDHLMFLYLTLAALGLTMAVPAARREVLAQPHARYFIAAFGIILTGFATVQFGLSIPVLYASFYAQLLIPSAFLCLAVIIGPAVERLTLTMWIACLASFVASLLAIVYYMDSLSDLYRVLGRVGVAYSVVVLVPSIALLAVGVLVRNAFVKTIALAGSVASCFYFAPAYNLADYTPSRRAFFSTNIALIDYLNRIDPERRAVFTFSSADKQAGYFRNLGLCPLHYWHEANYADLITAAVVQQRKPAKAIQSSEVIGRFDALLFASSDADSFSEAAGRSAFAVRIGPVLETHRFDLNGSTIFLTLAQIH